MASVVDLASALQEAVKEELNKVERLRMALEDERTAVEREREAFEEARRVVQALNKPCEDLVRINVGGQVFQTRRSTLCQEQDSALATMFSGRWDENLQRDDSGAIFLDVTPACFELVLSQLRALAFDPVTDLQDVEVPPGLKNEFAAFLKCMMNRDITPTADIAPEGSCQELIVSHAIGDFCGGTTFNHCAAGERYNLGEIGQILSGRVLASAGPNRQAIYCGVNRTHVPSSTIVIEFRRRHHLKGCRFMVARECGCRWRVAMFSVDAPLYCGNPFGWSGNQRAPEASLRTLLFGHGVVAQKLHITIDNLQDNMGFYSLTFF